jgi:hypothetical protein
VSEWIRVGPAAHCPPGWLPFVTPRQLAVHGPTIAATAGMIAPTGTRLTISGLIVAVRQNHCGGIISLRWTRGDTGLSKFSRHSFGGFLLFLFLSLSLSPFALSFIRFMITAFRVPTGLASRFAEDLDIRACANAGDSPSMG